MKKVKVLIILILILAVCGCGALVSLYLQTKSSDTFLEKTTLNGEDISGKNVQQVSDTIAEQYKDFNVQLMENDETVLEGPVSSFGYTYDASKAEKVLQDDLSQQKSGVTSILSRLISGEKLTLDASYDYDENAFKQYVVSSAFSIPRVASVNAEIVLNSDGTAYEVTQPVQGNEIDDTKLQTYVLDELNKAIDEGLSGETVAIEIPDDVYTSEQVDMDTSRFDEELDTKNKELKLKNTFQNMTVTYTFGSQTEVLDAATIMSWISYADDGSFQVDDAKVTEYVAALAKKYNTLHSNRKFKTHSGKTITIKSGKNMYGYRIIQDDECAQLKQDILAAQPVTREPIYKQKNDYGNPYYLARDGVDDLNGTYVEVSIKEQHVWFYKKGKLVVEGDCVTGNVSEDHGTITGIYPLAYKESPSVLTGGDAENGYRSEVKYWMPFNMGQGLHDASWRTEFGGDIYKKNGSHGCVNLPTDVAKKIYKKIQTGTAIIVHK